VRAKEVPPQQQRVIEMPAFCEIDLCQALAVTNADFKCDNRALLKARGFLLYPADAHDGSLPHILLAAAIMYGKLDPTHTSTHELIYIVGVH